MYNVGIVVYNGADEIEISAACELLTSIRTLENGKWTNDPVYDVKIVGEELIPYTTSHGVNITPSVLLSTAQALDIVVLPGGPGARLQKYPDSLLNWLCEHMPKAKYVLSFSTAAFILARAGLLKQRKLVTYPAFVADIKRIEPSANISANERIALDNGTLLSTSGIAMAFEACLAMVEMMEGFKSAEIAAKRIGWPMVIDEFVPIYNA